jgi:hypothetical protein
VCDSEQQTLGDAVGFFPKAGKRRNRLRVPLPRLAAHHGFRASPA